MTQKTKMKIRVHTYYKPEKRWEQRNSWYERDGVISSSGFTTFDDAIQGVIHDWEIEPDIEVEITWDEEMP